MSGSVLSRSVIPGSVLSRSVISGSVLSRSVMSESVFFSRSDPEVIKLFSCSAQYQESQFFEVQISLIEC